MTRAEEHWISAGPARLYAKSWRPLVESSAPAIVLFHDSLGSVELWRDFPSQLCAATQRRIIAYDRWGFGRSDAREGLPPGSFIVDEASVVPVLCEAFGLETFVAFGHSVGGCMAVACAATFQQQVGAVITMSAQTLVEARTRDGILAAQAGFADPKNFARLERYHGDKARWVLDAWTQTWLSDEYASWTLDDLLRQVRCPLLAIHGDRDEYGSTLHPQRIGALPTGKTSVMILENCGHLPHRERAGEVIAAVQGFLALLVS